MKITLRQLMVVWCCLATAAVTGGIVRRCTREQPGGKPAATSEIRRIIVHDTVFVDRPVVRTVRTIDTVIVAAKPAVVTNTVLQTDTVYIKLPIEQKKYSGKDYEAWVSGSRPSLDSIRIFKTSDYTVSTIQPWSNQRKRKWGIGLQAGYGIRLAETPQLTPYIGVGVSYNIIRF
jgi:hypothetical protein